MSSTRNLPAKKRPIGGYIDDYSASSGSSSESSASFQMEENSSDEEIDLDDCKDQDETSQINRMDNSQESNFSAPSPLGLGTQPLEVPSKKRKVSLSPQDSLAKRTRPQSPYSVVVMRGPSRNQQEVIPLLTLDDPHPSKPKSKTCGTPTSQFSSKQSGAFRVHAAISEASNEASASKAMGNSSAQKRIDEKDSPVVLSKKSTPKEKASAKSKKAKTMQTASDIEMLSEARSKANRKASPAMTTTKKAPKPETPPARATSKSRVPVVKASVVTAVEMSEAKAAAKQKVTSTGKKKEDKKILAAKVGIIKKAGNSKKKKKTFQDQLLHHVFFSCRPHTIKELTQHLKNESASNYCNEASVNYCLLGLIDKNWIKKKEFTSKSRSKELYWANDSSKNKELMAALDIVPPQEVAEARVKLASLQQQEKSSSMELHKVMQEPSNDELNERLANAEKEVACLHTDLDAILKRIAASKQPVATKQKFGLAKQKISKARSDPKRIKVEINRMRDEWKKRKEKCTDFVECLADGMEKKVKDVIKILELETDEDVGVKIPPKYDIKK